MASAMRRGRRALIIRSTLPALQALCQNVDGTIRLRLTVPMRSGKSIGLERSLSAGPAANPHPC
jgi:hypothetical protein